MNNKIQLPSLAEALYEGHDVLEILGILRRETQKLPGNFLYMNPIDFKFLELENIIKSIDNELPFTTKLKHVWIPGIRKVLSNDVSISFRQKSIQSLLLKMNRTMAEKKAIDSIHDLIGIEIIVNTRGPKDTEETINECYDVMNNVLTYFMTTTEHPDDRFLLCESAELKNSVPAVDHIGTPLSAAEKRELIEVKNDNLYIPEISKISSDFENFVKDYLIRPKKSSFYSGLQASLCHVDKRGQRVYFEIQVKTQNIYEFLNTKFLADGSINPAYHNTFRQIQTEINNSIKEEHTPQFSLEFNPEECYHICGFRPDPEYDCSGVISAKRWTIL